MVVLWKIATGNDQPSTCRYPDYSAWKRFTFEPQKKTLFSLTISFKYNQKRDVAKRGVLKFKYKTNKNTVGDGRGDWGGWDSVLLLYNFNFFSEQLKHFKYRVQFTQHFQLENSVICEYFSCSCVYT